MSIPVDLYFTQNIDNNEEYGLEYYHEVEEGYEDGEEDMSGVISPKRKSYSRHKDTDRDSFDSKADGDTASVSSSSSSSRRIKFHEFMKVVLIPTKEEYKKANCDLWWKRHDFLSFQKNANAELRLFSMIQNINIHEAKHQLYQPQPEDLADEASNTTSVHEMMEDFHDDPFYNLQDSQIFRRSESEEDNDREKQKMLASLKAAAEAEAAKEEAEVASAATPTTPNSTTIPSSSSAPSCLPPSIALPPVEEPHEPLNFCVPIQDPVPASNNSRVSKYRNTIASAGILAAMGLFSFAAPIIGFYFLSSQR